MGQPRVVIEDLTVRFPFVYDKATTIRDRARQFYKKVKFNKSPRFFTALSGINLTVNDGDIIGLIGPNGCGKSTLLMAISGIYYPDEGAVDTHGNISTLLSLGTGFDNSLSGIDNVMLNGYIMGLPAEEIKAKIPGIIEFADIGEHIYAPMRYYSKGMVSRLSFSIVLAMQPDILLIDEVFSVGDYKFRKKSEAAMGQLLDKASCQIIATHSMSLVEEHCNRALFLNKGTVMMDGNPKEVVEAYIAFCNK